MYAYRQMRGESFIMHAHDAFTHMTSEDADENQQMEKHCPGSRPSGMHAWEGYHIVDEMDLPGLLVHVPSFSSVTRQFSPLSSQVSATKGGKFALRERAQPFVTTQPRVNLHISIYVAREKPGLDTDRHY